MATQILRYLSQLIRPGEAGATAAEARASLQLGTAATQPASAFATATQGMKADSALQPTGDGSGLTGLTKGQVGLPNVPNVDATARANHTGTQLAGTISDLAATLASYLAGHLSAGSNVTIATDPTTKVMTISASGGGGATLPSTTSLFKGDGAGGATAATAGTDYPGLATANAFAGTQAAQSQSPTDAALVARGSGSGDQLFLSCNRGSDGYNFINLKSQFGTTGNMLLEVNAAGFAIDLAGGFSVLQSGVRTFGVVGLASWADSVDSTLFQVGAASASAIYSGAAGNPLVRAGFIASSFQFGPTAYGSIRVPTAMAEFAGTDAARPVLAATGAASQAAPLVPLRGVSSTGSVRDLGYLDAGFVVATDATRTGYIELSAADFTGTNRKGLRVASDGTQALVGFFGATAVPRPATPTTLADVIAGLRALGLFQ